MRRIITIAAAALLLFACAARAEETVIEPIRPVPQYVQWLLDVARQEMGYTEERSGYTKYGEWSGDPYAQWCAEFLCWCVDQVDQQHGTHLLRQVYPLYNSSNWGLKWFLRQGRYIARTGYVKDWGTQWFTGQDERMASASYVPQPGDWVFYTFDDQGNTAHVAMVEYCAVDESGQIRAHVIEGNMPDKVQRSSHLLTDWRVLGYGTVHDLADTVITNGCQGRKVLLLQQKLQYLGYLAEGNLDSQYVTPTIQAVRAFQTDIGIEATGVANRQTQLALDAAYQEAYWREDANFVIEGIGQEEENAGYGADPEF